ncbi:hypothetical protein KHC23_22915 [Ancylobacter dichloromethanicus]|uniref:Uncharacterized protein n=1 Tax=Ancylobacter dichloromethanicus TaxID=518825 RepID=A0A9W6JF68_9HYPH|nr:hypothetical protein [Ancylobacter dichloromethanicus]MBS7556486.1 hypothetical protein [Ancylobacter dichloromethanicus]GLK74705.1 hypothetical protein GCM10017643_48240 [Ancylobacter dichloromethanicus]
MITEVTTGTVPARRPKTTASQYEALRLLVAKGPARRVRRGWCWGSFEGPFIATPTLDALEKRGLVLKRQNGTCAVVTVAGRALHDELAEERA